jgi:hypothetical protein
MGSTTRVMAVWDCPLTLDLPHRDGKRRRGLTHMLHKDLTVSGPESMLRSPATSWTLSHEVGGSI